jgi:hypothetical protein
METLNPINLVGTDSLMQILEFKPRFLHVSTPQTIDSLTPYIKE